MKHAAPTATPNPFDVRAMWRMADTAFADEESAYRGWLERAASLQSEATAFWNARLGKDVATLTALGQCANPGEAFELQMKYMRDAMADCYTEGQRVMQLMYDVARESKMPDGRDMRAARKAA